MANTTNLIPLNGDSFTEGELQAFEAKYFPVIKEYAEVVKQKKAFEAKEKMFKSELGKAMDELGIKTMDCPFLRFTRVDAGEDKRTIDLDAFQAAEPVLFDELVNDYPKIVKGKSAYVKFDVK